MSDTPLVPGTPNPGEAAELLTNPDLNVPGILVLDGNDLPPDKTIGRMARTKLTMPGSYIKPDVLPPRRIVIIDKSRPELIPDILLENSDEREEWIGNIRKRDFWINLLGGGDDGELGELIRETLMEDESVYNLDTKEDIPGYYDPVDDEKKVGEQRAFVVLAAS